MLCCVCLREYDRILCGVKKNDNTYVESAKDIKYVRVISSYL